MRKRFARICGAVSGRYTCRHPGHSGQHQDGLILWGRR